MAQCPNPPGRAPAILARAILAPAILVTAAVALLAASSPAAAVEGCRGTYSSGTYAALPSPLVLALDQSHSSPTDPALVTAFIGGLTQSGQATTGTPTLMLSLHYQVFNPGGGGGTGGLGAMGQSMAGGNTGWTTAPTPGSQGGGSLGQSNMGLSGLGGGPDLQMPGLPKIGTFSFNAPPPSPPVLTIRAEARPAGSERMAWVATMQCQVTTTDSEELAYQIGMFLGSIVGQRVERAPM